MKLLDNKIIKEKIKNDVKSVMYLLIEESKDRYSVVTFTSYEKWSLDGKTYHIEFQSKDEAQKFFDDIK